MTSADLNQQISKELHELRHATDNRSQERSWILAQLDNDKLEKEVLTLSVVALHILSALTKEDLTGIKLATKLSVTRAVQNLIKYQFLTTYQSESDKKKIFYHLTVKGRKVATIHDKMHKIMDIRLGQIFDKYNEQEKSIILSFLSDFNLTEAGLFDSE